MKLKKHLIFLACLAAVLTVNTSLFAAKKAPKERPVPIADYGTDKWIDYSKYGRFENVGTKDYKYVITNMKALRAASGEGVYPNAAEVFKNPYYKELKKQNKLPADKWKHVNSTDYVTNFFVWATAQEEPGTRQYYTALALDNAGEYEHAVKAYYSLVVNFPRAVGVSFWGDPWYMGPVALDRIKYLTREHPELGIKLEGAEIKVLNKYGNGMKQGQQWIVTPGKLVKATKKDFNPKKLNLKKIGVKKVTGKGNVKLIQYNNNHFELEVDGKPFILRGMDYSPTQVGLTPDNGSVNVSLDWQWADINKNGKIDGPYDSWVDVDRSNIKPDDVKPVGDFQLLKDMGVNSIRIYHSHGSNKELFMDGYKNYGLYFSIGNMLGMYGTDSGAEWFKGTDYTNPEQKARLKESVRKMVEDFKDEPYVLMWILGNENNYGEVGVPGVKSGTSNQARTQPEAYYGFVNEMALFIKEIDPYQRPVAVSNGDVFFLHYAAKHAPDVDIFAANAYRGESGFGSIWQDVMDLYEKPVMFGEFGCPAYHKYYPLDVAEKMQASYHKSNWLDIEANKAGYGTGNALGGYIFEWCDEWWKAGPPPEYNPSVHDTTSQWGGPFLDGWAYEEWFGITSQGDGSDSPFMRQLRPAYFMYKDLWEKYRKEK